MGQTSIYVGLLSPARELEGVVCFGSGPQGDTRKVVGEPAICLERGACVHYAPPNAASFLIRRACKLVQRIRRDRYFLRLCRSGGGRIWRGLSGLQLGLSGQGISRTAGSAGERTMVLPPREDPSDLTKWRTARVLREPRQGRRLTLAEACEQGWRIGCREAKHLYAINLGRDRRRWLKSIVARRNPAPRPDLKGGRTISGTDKDKAQRLHDKLGEALA